MYSDPKKKAEYNKGWRIRNRERYNRMQAERKRIYRALNPDYQRPTKEQSNRATRKYVKKIKPLKQQLVSEFKKAGCCLCREMDPVCLDAHHVNPVDKIRAIANMLNTSYTVERLARELSKCVCVCKNCHARLHAKTVSLPISLVAQIPEPKCLTA